MADLIKKVIGEQSMGTTAEEGGPGRASARARGGEWRAIWGNLKSLSGEINPPHRAGPPRLTLS